MYRFCLYNFTVEQKADIIESTPVIPRSKQRLWEDGDTNMQSARFHQVASLNDISRIWLHTNVIGGRL